MRPVYIKVYTRAMVVKTEITTGTFDPRNYKVECLIVILLYCTLVQIMKMEIFG